MSKLNQILKLLTISACFCLALAVPGLSQTQAPMPGMPSMPQINQAQLTETTAKNAVDSYLAMKNEFDDDDMPDLDPSSSAAGLQGMQNYHLMHSLIAQYGFADVQEWHSTVMSVVIAWNFIDEDQMEEFEKSLEQMKMQNIPEPMLSQMIAMLENIKPSENNLAVVQILIDDPEYGPKITEAAD